MDQQIKRAAPQMDSSSNLNVMLGGSDEINNNTPLRLNKEGVIEITKHLSSKAYQEIRFIKHLAFNPLDNTKSCCKAIACVNLSHLRRRTAKVLFRFGLEARCVSPGKPIKNGFGENTSQKLWALYKVNGGDI